MTEEDTDTLKRYTMDFFLIVSRSYAHEVYRDELAAEMRRIDSELQELDQERLDCMKKIGLFIFDKLF